MTVHSATDIPEVLYALGEEGLQVVAYCSQCILEGEEDTEKGHSHVCR